MDKEYDIFISYRRVDSEGRTSGRDIARTIKLELEKRGYKVFFDYSEIKDGDFEDIILPSVRSSSIFILVLSKDALVRCTNEGDWVRREIAIAIESGCQIIPVSPDNAFNGWPSALPAELMPLTRIDISEVAMGKLFEKSIDKLEEDRISIFRKKNYGKEDIDFQSINYIFHSIGSWLRDKYRDITNTWGERSLFTNIIYCLYFIPLYLLLFVFVEILNHQDKDLLDLSIGFYTITYIYGVIQLLLNRRDGIYIIMLSPVITVTTGYCMSDRYSSHLWDSTVLLILFSIPLLLSLLIRKNGKSAWKQMKGGVFGLLKWKRHFLYYLWCVAWVLIVIYKNFYRH